MKRIILLLLIFTICLSSCNVKKIAEIILASPDNSETKPIEQEEKVTLEESLRQHELYRAIYMYDIEKTKQYIKEGYNVNKSKGEEGWMVGTPLNIIARNIYNTYTRLVYKHEMSEVNPDIEILNLLIEAKADVNNRPYIWCRVYEWNNFHVRYIEKSKYLTRIGREPETEEEKREKENEKVTEIFYFFYDINNILEAFLKAGADPDMRGHPYPYSRDSMLKGMTDEKAKEYFAKGTRPINEAIKKGIRWESQVDLLLQYTTLDEDSLEAAKESKDPAMIEKINKLWKEQNENK